MIDFDHYLQQIIKTIKHARIYSTTYLFWRIRFRIIIRRHVEVLPRLWTVISPNNARELRQGRGQYCQNQKQSQPLRSHVYIFFVRAAKNSHAKDNKTRINSKRFHFFFCLVYTERYQYINSLQQIIIYK